MTLKTFSRVTPLSLFWEELSISIASGRKIVARDPDFPADELVQVGVTRLGITERGKALYQQVLAERARQPRAIPANLRDPRAAAAKSVKVRQAKAEERAKAAA